MAFLRRDPAGKTPRKVRELGEDLSVAILEFLDRNPLTSSREIRQALHLVERSVGDRAGRDDARLGRRRSAPES
jgi:hypothetical protein